MAVSSIDEFGRCAAIDRYFARLGGFRDFLTQLDFEDAVFVGGAPDFDMISQTELALETPAGNALVQVLPLFLSVFLTGDRQKVLLCGDADLILRKACRGQSDNVSRVVFTDDVVGWKATLIAEPLLSFVNEIEERF